MVARGDLGAELPIENVPLLQVISLFLIDKMIEIIVFQKCLSCFITSIYLSITNILNCRKR